MGLYSKVIDLQKLQTAWQRVRKNKPAAGVDGITVEQFDLNSKEELKALHQELVNHEYEALPVKVTTIYKEEKAREIALYSMRDKVVQQSLAAELNRIYDGRFSNSTYAYRSNRSALSAIGLIDAEIQKGIYAYVLKVDIRRFFDEILWDRLERVLRKDIPEDDVIALIKANCASTRLDASTGELVEKTRGIYQGSGVSPILSNIYLMELDQWLVKAAPFCIRYSDDLIVLGKKEQALQELLAEISARLMAVGLQVNVNKSVCVNLADGVNFLGYHFDSRGKSIPAKAEENLSERLETMWLTSADLPIEAKLDKAKEITGGWEQYFREDREIASIYEYCTMVPLIGEDADRLAALAARRPALENISRDIMVYLAAYWKEHGRNLLELLEYEQYYQIPQVGTLQDERVIHDLLADYRKFVILESTENALDLMQDYSDAKNYENAAWWMKRKDALDKASATIETVHMDADHQEIRYNRDTAAKVLRLLVGREDVYGKESIGYDRKRGSDLQTKPLTEAEIMEHLGGSVTLGTYIQRSNATVHYIVIDVDISKRVLIGIKDDVEARRTYLNKALLQAQRIEKELEHMGLRGYIEYSGYRGFHVWVFLTEWMPVRYANMFQEILETKIPEDEDLAMEFFPNKTHLKPGKFGQVLKIPFGIHLRSGERSYFYDEGMRPVMDVNAFLDGVARFTIGAIKKVLATNTGIKESENRREVDEDLSVFGDLTSDIRTVLGGCTLMRYLCLKSKSTCYLTHFERLSVLYVFGHLGDSGRQFVHQVMSYTLNYNYNTTERFIRKCPEKPVSCLKLREQYKKVTAEIGCSCNFKLAKNCYPSPVLHAVAKSNDIQAEITLPVSRTISADKKREMVGEINIHAKAQDCAKRILELKKQQRALDQSIRKVERELQTIYDNAGIDSLEIESGVLTRRQQPDGSVEWVIAL